MLRKEFRVILPISIEEYQVAQLWATAEASKNETGGGEGIEVIENKPYEENGVKGQYTKKWYHLQSRIPAFLRFLLPDGSMDILEEAWNAYPYCKTVITNPGYMKDGFEICIQSLHKPSLGDEENVHGLPLNEWKNTEIIKIDVANDFVHRGDYKEEFDPAKFKSQKCGRGHLGSHWIEQLKAQKQCEHLMDTPLHYMCAYKLVSCRFKWFGLQNRVESMIMKQEQRLFTLFNRQLFCWIDNWYGMTMEEIRELEDKTKNELDQMRKEGDVRGMKVDD